VTDVTLLANHFLNLTGDTMCSQARPGCYSAYSHPGGCVAAGYSVRIDSFFSKSRRAGFSRRLKTA